MGADAFIIERCTFPTLPKTKLQANTIVNTMHVEAPILTPSYHGEQMHDFLFIQSFIHIHTDVLQNIGSKEILIYTYTNSYTYCL